MSVFPPINALTFRHALLVLVVIVKKILNVETHKFVQMVSVLKKKFEYVIRGRVVFFLSSVLFYIFGNRLFWLANLLRAKSGTPKVHTGFSRAFAVLFLSPPLLLMPDGLLSHFCFLDLLFSVLFFCLSL